MKINNSKTYYISVVFFLILHARIFLSAKIKIQENLTKDKNFSELNTEINKIKSKFNSNLRSNSSKENSNMSYKIDKLEKALSYENEINRKLQNYKITPISKEKNSAEKGFIEKLKNLKVKANGDFSKKIEDESNETDNLIMDYFQKIKIDEFMSLNEEKEDNMENNKSFSFFKNISFVMISMIIGGVFGLLFILFFSYRDNLNKNSN